MENKELILLVKSMSKDIEILDKNITKLEKAWEEALIIKNKENKQNKA